MSGEDHLGLFKTAFSQWLLTSYSVEIRYIARKTDNANYKILSAYLAFLPIATPSPINFRVATSKIVAGFEQLSNLTLKEIEGLTNGIEVGKLRLKNLEISLESKSGLSFHSEMISNDRWFCDAHLIVLGDALDAFSAVEVAEINNELRLNELPFDGVNDLLSYLRLSDCVASYKQPYIEVRISPPIDLIVEKCKLSNGQLHLVLHAHLGLDLKNISLAIRTFPEALSMRRQVAKDVIWTTKVDHQVGYLELDINNSFASEAILMLGKNTIRRQFFEDISKVPNKRLVTLSFFDKELKRLKEGLFGTDGVAFEKAVNALAYLLGFSGCILNESDAPDIILSTPNENVVIIECTTRIGDFDNKLGKLVDRKNSLIKELAASGDSRKVYSYLVCGQAKDRIVIDAKKLAVHKVTLLTQESLQDLLGRLKFPENLEQLLIQDEVILENFLMQQN